MALGSRLSRHKTSLAVLLALALLSLISTALMSSRSYDAVKVRSDGKSTGGCLTTARQDEVEKVIRDEETRGRSSAFEKIFKENFWGGGESRSGPGSRRDYTENVRKLIGHALSTYDIQEVLDAPCGDVNWQLLIPGFNETLYTGFDIVPDLIERNKDVFKDRPNMRFGLMDIANAPGIADVVQPDIVICRDAIQHNSLKDGLRALANLESTGAKYILTNWHTLTRPNVNIDFGEFYLVDVFTHPFNFSPPEMFIAEGVAGYTSEGKYAGIWKHPALLKGDGTPFEIPPSLLKKSKRDIVTWAEVEAERGKTKGAA